MNSEGINITPIGMETIPQDIFFSILDCLSYKSRRELLPFVTVSYRWQYTMDRQAFQRLEVKNTELSTLENISRETEANWKSLVRTVCLSIRSLSAYALS